MTLYADQELAALLQDQESQRVERKRSGAVENDGNCTMKTIAFFNNKGDVDKTSLVYHLAWMYADLGLSVVPADLDPQANLTSMFLDEDRLEALWMDGGHAEAGRWRYWWSHGGGTVLLP